MKIPFYRPTIGPEEINEVIDTLNSGWLTTGPKTKLFECEFARYIGSRHAIAVNSCTAALHLALESVGVKSGQSVVVPTMTFAATAEVVRYFGAQPILADCLEEDFNLDILDADRRIQAALALEQNVTAIIPVHFGGQVANVQGVQRLAQKFNLKIIEDAAHCCPAYYRSPHSTGTSGQVNPSSISDSAFCAAPSPWLPVGTSADISCYSFYANKTITTGEGGMACTNNDSYADRIRVMSLHGISKDAWKRYTGEASWYYEIIAPGFKYNLTDIAAAIGIQQLRKADSFLRRRTEIVMRYGELLKEVEEIILPRQLPNRIHSWHLYVIRLKLDRIDIDRAQFIAELQQCGVGVSVHWMPLHMHPYYRETYGYSPKDLPTAAALYPEMVTLPLYPGMSDDDVLYVCAAIKRIVSRHQRISHARISKRASTVEEELLGNTSASGGN